ncbi:MAG: tRNA (adenosine(37)-N6)-dimethylallyltransferase MiaA [Nitrospira sp.]
MKPKLLIILGPTASGKSDLAVKIAKKYNGEVVSADSRQVYKGLDIGSGKITKKEMRGVPHYMLDVISPKKTFSVSDFQKSSSDIIKKIQNRGKLPVVCGGTGFYIQSIVDGLVLPEVPPNKKLRESLEKKSISDLQKILKDLDINRYKNIDIKNPARLVRAIEIAKSLGEVPRLKKLDSGYDILQIGIKLSDEDLKDRINKRLLSRMKKGMVDEAKKLHKNGLPWKRMREFGLEYRYLADFCEKKITKDDLIKKIEIENWRYAKRQMTWFKKDKRIKWFPLSDIKDIEKEVDRFIAE